MTDTKYIYFNSRDELYKVAVPEIIYIEAESNYTRIILANGQHALVGMNLGKMEQFLSCRSAAETPEFARIGRRFIINMRHIFRINIPRQELVLSDQRTFSYVLNISKEALKNLKDVMMQTITQNRQQSC